MLPIVWILGASGVGKSTVGFRLLLELAGDGVVAALVDADQLRLARGIPATEMQLISAGLPPLEREFRARGARVLIVSGIADDAGHLAALLEGVEGCRVFTVHLDVDAETLRERIRRRGSLLDEMEENVAAAAKLDPDWADLRIDTVGKTPDELAAMIAAEIIPYLHGDGEAEAAATIAETGGVPQQVVMISGPGGAGLSTVGYSVYSWIAATGRRAGYLDAHQLGFLGLGSRSPALASMRAVNVHAVAGALSRAGAQTIVVTGDPGTIRLLDGAWSDIPRTGFWLHASQEALAERITERAAGNGPGNHRVGLTGRLLTDSISAAIAESHDGTIMPEGTVTIDTSAIPAEQVAEIIVGVIEQQMPPSGRLE